MTEPVKRMPTDIAVCRYCRLWEKNYPGGSTYGADSTVGWCRRHSCKTWESGACGEYQPTPYAMQKWKASQTA